MDFYVVPTPIGNYEDITVRALRVLQEVDFVVCEHHKEYIRLCAALSLPVKEYIECQRKRERDAIEVVLQYAAERKKGALVSDCGTPLFEDPGFMVLREIVRKGINIISLPGANSLITALPLSHFEIKDFYFAGFISQKKGERERDLQNLLKRRETVILLETPYRLRNIIDLLVQYAPERELFVPFDLTMPTAKNYRGTAKQIKNALEKDQIEKGEFLLLIRGR